MGEDGAESTSCTCARRLGTCDQGSLAIQLEALQDIVALQACHDVISKTRLPANRAAPASAPPYHYSEEHHSQGRQIHNPMSGGVRADVSRKRETDESACRKWVGRPVSTPWHSLQKQSAAPGTDARGKGHKGEKEIPASDDGDAVPEGCGYHIYTVIPPNGFVEVEDGLGQVIRSLSPAVRPPLYRYSAHIPCRMHIRHIQTWLRAGLCVKACAGTPRVV